MVVEEYRWAITPELNPSTQSSLLRFFTGDFKF